MAINFLNTVAVDDSVLFVDTINDRVGIGTDSPTNGKLVIDSTANQIAVETGTAGDGRLNIGHFSNGTFIGTYGDDGGAADLIRFGTHSGDERMRIDSSGNVGIGTTNMYARLNVKATSHNNGISVNRAADNTAALYIGNDGGGTPILAANNADMIFGRDFSGTFTERMRLTNGGNVGIGTTSPTANLHVQGSSATDVPIIRSGGFGNSGSKLELAETLTNGDMNYGFSFFNDGNSSNTLMIKAHNNSTTGTTAITIGRANALTTFSTVPIVGTRTAGDNSTYAASTAFVTAAVAAVSGDITSVTAGTGLTGGGTSGAVTLNVIGGDGITANANDIEVDSTVVRTTGSTMTGTLDFSGSSIGRAITITADSTLDSSNASIYLGNAPTNYGFDIQYTGSASGNNNSLDIISTNAGSPVTALKILQSGATTFSSDATFEGNIEVDGEIVQTSSGGENQFASPLNMGSNKIVDLANPTTAQDAATKAYVDSAVSAPTAPAAPTTVTTAVVGETIEVTFNQSATSNIDYYQVWSADPSGDFGIIAQIAPSEFATTMTVVDSSFNVSGTMSYRVYAVKLGIYSSAATSTQAFSAPALSVTAMTVVNLNTAYYVQYEKPSSRFIDNIEIYMDSQTTQAALNRSNASIVYSGQNASYMRNVGASNNFHQFWVEVTTT